MQAFLSQAVEASTAMLVPETFLPHTAGLNQILMGATLVTSAPLGALAVSSMSLGWALSIDVFTALLCIAPLFFFTVPQFRKEEGNRHLLKDLFSELREGIELVLMYEGHSCYLLVLYWLLCQHLPL